MTDAPDRGTARRSVTACVVALLSIVTPYAPVARAAEATEAEAIRRGGEVFASRCAVCHGVQADGRSKLADVLVVKPPNLRETPLSAAQRQAIVTNGGASVGRTPNMPAWRDELAPDELAAVLAFLSSIAPSHTHAAAR